MVVNKVNSARLLLSAEVRGTSKENALQGSACFLFAFFWGILIDQMLAHISTNLKYYHCDAFEA